MQTIENIVAALPLVGRVHKIEWQGKTVWVKRATRFVPQRLYYAQKLLSPLIPVAAFRPTFTLGGAEGLAHEAARLRAMEEKGLRVPHVLMVTNEWMVLDGIGINVDTYLKTHLAELTHDEVYGILAACGRALADLHNAGFSHGRAKLNDMTLGRDGKIGFIDFEEKVDHLPPLALQAREIWMLLQSVARYADAYPKAFSVCFESYRATAQDKGQYAELHKIVSMLGKFAAMLAPVMKKKRGDIGRAFFATRYLQTISF